MWRVRSGGRCAWCTAAWILSFLSLSLGFVIVALGGASSWWHTTTFLSLLAAGGFRCLAVYGNHAKLITSSIEIGTYLGIYFSAFDPSQ